MITLLVAVATAVVANLVQHLAKEFFPYAWKKVGITRFFLLEDDIDWTKPQEPLPPPPQQRETAAWKRNANGGFTMRL